MKVSRFLDRFIFNPIWDMLECLAPKLSDQQYKYECSVCHDFFCIEDIAYSLGGRTCTYPHVCNQCNISIVEAAKERVKIRVWNELGLKYHKDIGKAGDFYYDFIIYENGKEGVVRTSSAFIDNAKDPQQARLDSLKIGISYHQPER